MTLTLLTPPAAEPVSVAEAKAHLRVTYDAEDALIGRLITAARERVEAELGVSLITTAWRETRGRWPSDAEGAVLLARGPLLAVDAAASVPLVGSAAAVGTPVAEVGSRPARAVFASGAPALSFGSALRIDYRAGFADAAEDVPEGLRQAVLALVAAGFDSRGAAPPVEAAEPWLRPWRRVRL